MNFLRGPLRELEQISARLTRLFALTRDRGATRGKQHGSDSVAAELRVNACDDELRLASAADTPVLITCENGATREACARLIHNAGRSSHTPLVTVSAKHIKTEAVNARGGTLFVDDIAELDAYGQAQLLAWLDERLASQASWLHLSNRGARIIAGASRHLDTERASGAFSETLFYRLNIIHVDLALPSQTKAN